MTTSPSRPVRGFIPLFWRLFIPNATVLAAACVVLIIEPANGRIPALVGGLLLMLRERALTIDARLHVGRAPDRGTGVVLRLPAGRKD